MSIATLILGASGTGKTTSLRNIDPATTLLIQCIKKPLPFKSSKWLVWDKVENPKGNVFQTDDGAKILAIINKAPHKVIIIDDYQASMVNELMSRSSEKGFSKFESIGKNAWSIFNASGALAPDKRVYILAHTQTDDFGAIKMKTVGKMVDNTIVPESYFSIVLRSDVSNGQYVFRTQTNGNDCCKSPIDMFEGEMIPNDLNAVDQSICNFYDINQSKEEV